MTTISSIIEKIKKPNFFSRLVTKIASPLFLEQWTVLLASNTNYKSLKWSSFSLVRSPLDRFWADPFILKRNNTYYLFVEEYIYSLERGRIACLTLDNQQKIKENQLILDKPYHLSYPFIFEYDNNLYMIPESSQNKTIDLYRCDKFPATWVFEKTLINNITAFDTTVVLWNNKWWLFTNILSENNSSWDTLCLYYTDHLLSGHWQPHPLNPIVKDISSARPAGRIFIHEGNLIRPSQDCAIRYGGAIKFNHITIISEIDYKEEQNFSLKPKSFFTFLATHTYNTSGEITSIDAMHRRVRFSKTKSAGK